MSLAAACTARLTLAPPARLPGGAVLRTVALLGMWGVVGVVLLTLRPQLSAVQRAWAGYEGWLASLSMSLAGQDGSTSWMRARTTTFLNVAPVPLP